MFNFRPKNKIIVGSSVASCGHILMAFYFRHYCRYMIQLFLYDINASQIFFIIRWQEEFYIKICFFQVTIILFFVIVTFYFFSNFFAQWRMEGGSDPLLALN